MLCRALWFIFHIALWLCLFMALINLSYLSCPSIYLPVSWRLNYSNEARCSEAIWFKHLLTSVAPVYLRLCPPTLCNDVLSTSWKGEGSTRISSISIGLSISFSSHTVICNSEYGARSASLSWRGKPLLFIQICEFSQRWRLAFVVMTGHIHTV